MVYFWTKCIQRLSGFFQLATYRITAIMAALCAIHAFHANGQLAGSFYNYFSYLNPQTTATTGADLVSDAVVFIRADITDSTAVAATGFFVNTFRDDHKVCFCTSGHVIDDIFPGAPVLGAQLDLESSFKFIGHPDPNNIIYNQTTSKYNTTLPAQLLAYTSRFVTGSELDQDFALLLVDEDFIPVQHYATLGVSDENSFTLNDRFFTVGHPYALAQRIIDSMQYTFHEQGGNYYYLRSLSPRQNVAYGASGSPLLKKTASGSYVTGIMTGFVYGSLIPPAIVNLTDPGETLVYSGSPFVNNMTALMPAIKANCWKTKTEQQIIAGNEDKTSVRVDNTGLINALYYLDHIFVGTSGIQSQRNVNYTINNPGHSLVTGKTVTVIGEVDPNAEANLAKIYIVSPVTELNHTFSYTAAAGKELHVNSILLEPSSTQTTRKTTGQDMNGQNNDGTRKQVLVVYPNPTQGLVNISGLPESTVPYDMQVYNIAGVLVKQKSCTGNICTIDLSGMPDGCYPIRVVRQGKELVHERIIKRSAD